MYYVIYDYDDGEWSYSLRETFSSRADAVDFMERSKGDPFLSNFELASEE